LGVSFKNCPLRGEEKVIVNKRTTINNREINTRLV